MSGSATRERAKHSGFVACLLRQSDPVACILLSIKFDPFIVTIYLRRGRFGGMSPRDWRIFLLSWLIARLARRSAPYLLHRPLRCGMGLDLAERNLLLMDKIGNRW